MDFIVHMHAIPSIGTLTEEKSKNQVRLELKLYFKQLMCIAASANLQMSVDIMHTYVAGLVALKTMIHMLHEEMDRGARSVYLDDTKEREKRTRSGRGQESSMNKNNETKPGL